MKPRRIPARAERVYTYNLSRLPKEERKPFTGPQAAVNRYNSTPSGDPDKKRNYEYEKKTGVPNKPETERPISREKKQQQNANDFDLIAWGNSDDETQDFYDKMQEHEVGDPGKEESPDTKLPKTHDGEIPDKFLNTPVEKHLAAGKDTPQPDKKETKPQIPDFLEGDQVAGKNEPLA